MTLQRHAFKSVRLTSYVHPYTHYCARIPSWCIKLPDRLHKAGGGSGHNTNYITLDSVARKRGLYKRKQLAQKISLYEKGQPEDKCIV